jgi:hypothetical protein
MATLGSSLTEPKGCMLQKKNIWSNLKNLRRIAMNVLCTIAGEPNEQDRILKIQSANGYHKVIVILSVQEKGEESICIDGNELVKAANNAMNN